MIPKITTQISGIHYEKIRLRTFVLRANVAKIQAKLGCRYSQAANPSYQWYKQNQIYKTKTTAHEKNQIYRVITTLKDVSLKAQQKFRCKSSNCNANTLKVQSQSMLVQCLS